MTQYVLTAPDGRKFKVNAPEGATREEVMSFAQQRWDRRKAIEADTKREMAKLADPTGTFSENVAAGFGKAWYDLARGAGQLVGMGPSAEEVSEMRRRDAPLMGSAGGVTGNLAGNITAFAPVAALAPGAATVAGAGALGATFAGLQPTTSPQERLTNQAVGFGLGAGSQALGTTVATQIGQRQAAAQAARTEAAMRDSALRQGQQAGYVVPPSAVRPRFLTNRLESIAGKAALGQEASSVNQRVTNQLARRYLGLPPNSPLSESAIEGVRTAASKPYKEVASISPQAANVLERLKQARFDTNAYFKHYNTSADPSSLAKARQSSALAEQLETALEKLAARAGKPQLIPELRAGRQMIAKTYEVERALNVSTGDVSARTFGRALDRGRPLTGEARTIGQFAEAFPAYTREGASIPTPGVSKTEALASMLLGLGGYGATGSPLGLAAAALPLASGPVRAGLLSGPGQTAFAQPSYGGMLSRVDPATAGLLTRGLGPAIGLPFLQQQ